MKGAFSGRTVEIQSEEPQVTNDEKRSRLFTWKALQNAIDAKQRELEKDAEALQKAYTATPHAEEQVHSLRAAASKYERTLEALGELYRQDRWGNYAEEARLTEEFSRRRLERAHVAISKATTGHPYERDETASRISGQSRRTASSRTSTSSIVKMRALAEAAAAKEQAEFERILADKQNERRQHEAEELRRRADYDREIAILAANKVEAVANAKLKAIQESIRDEEETRINVSEGDEAEYARQRVQTWVHTLSPSGHDVGTGQGQGNGRDCAPVYTAKEAIPPPTKVVASSPEKEHFKAEERKSFVPDGRYTDHQPVYRPLVTSTPKEAATSQCMEMFTTTNQQLVAGLARQSLPKCHPDIFDGDVTLFHPWKSAFKAMIRDADVSHAQEINYLHNYTKGQVQALVNNFRKRQHRDPAAVLRDTWTELERRFGNTAAITNALLDRLSQAARFTDRDKSKLQTFADLCDDIDSQLAYLPGLSCLNYPNAICPIVEKLPSFLRSKWEKEVVHHAEKYQDAYPGFHDFASMVQRQARLKNHPNVLAGAVLKPDTQRPRGDKPRETKASTSEADTNRRVLRTSTKPSTALSATTPNMEKQCPFHERKGHELTECKAFSEKTLKEKTDWIKSAGLCFRCLRAQHRAKECQADIKCSECGSDRHLALLHKDKGKDHGEELQSACTAICSYRAGGLSCSKIVLVDVFPEKRPMEVHRVYAIVDDQSNASMISPEFADKLGMTGPKEKYYLSTCSSEKEAKYGRRISGLIVKSAEGKLSKLPTLVECEHIPQDKNEIPTPQIARKFPHLQEIADHILPLDPNAKVQLLIGRDAPELMKVRAFRNGPKGAPWAQKLDLGWTISGQVCLDRIGGPVHIAARRTEIEGSAGEDSLHYDTVPCMNQFRIKERYSESHQKKEDGDSLFCLTSDDDEVSLSWEDRRFLDIMERGIHKNAHGNWEMPLPFRSHNVSMPNNRSQAVSRLNGLLRSFKRKPELEQHYCEFMAKAFERGHAVPVHPEGPPNRNTVGALNADHLAVRTNGPGRVWYLPHFGVYHPKKPNQVRVVFDSSAEYQGVSLNKQLLTGPDQMNSLLGVLVRFRRENVAVMCDVEQMFHSFHVNPEHRDFLRFLWYKDNDPAKEIIDYQMTVHLFGNGPSPAVATFGLRKTADVGEEEFGTSAKEFVHRDFYVDDGLTSRPTINEATELIKNTQGMLATANLRLHKVVSNSVPVMEALPAEDRAKDIRDLDLRHDALPTQRTLGVCWALARDSFTFRVSLPEKPFTRRGVLSIINSVYDPLGFVAPVLLEGKLILRELVILGNKKGNANPLGWDDPLPENQMRRWQDWKATLAGLENVLISRCYHPDHFGPITRAEIHAFSDASQDGIGTAVYLRLINERKQINVSFLFGQARVAPTHSTTIPRLELCAAVLTSQAVQRIVKELSVEINQITFYTDSKVVLGYIQNESRRFYVYVANRVQKIRAFSGPSQWRYVDTATNPADLATRGVDATNFLQSQWLCGPEFLQQTSPVSQLGEEEIALSEDDPEVRRQLTVLSTGVKTNSGLGSNRFDRFSKWSSVLRAVANLIVKVKEFKEHRDAKLSSDPKGVGFGCSDDADRKKQAQTCNRPKRRLLPRLPLAAELEQATTVVIKAVQQEEFASDIKTLANVNNHDCKDLEPIEERKTALKKSHLYRLDPFRDDDGVLRVGGRLRRSDLELSEKHPVLLPKEHHISKLVVKHHHAQVHHQGRQITHGAVRRAGYWIIGSHRAVAKTLSTCIPCKKARGHTITQHMADLPADRTTIAPPFTNVGFDVFGPWTIQTRKLRGGAVNSKRWGLVFTCLSSRAIHIEVLEAMDASAFICALRRFFAIRGPAARLRCDRGTNFIGGKSELDNALMEMDQEKIKRYSTEQGCEWLFNPPHASHFGGVWERQIGTIRRVLDAMLLEIGSSQLTHELLVTLMAEVTGIVNARPITAIPSDVDEPQPLTPAMLLTMKTRPLAPPPGFFVPQDLYARRRWRRSQYLADQFWLRWKREYLANLQVRPKWNEQRRNLIVGDIVTIREKEAHRNHWPMGRITEAIKSEDGQVRKAKVMTWRGGEKKTYLRPVGELILILPAKPRNAPN